jgi:hypothetical protein
MKLAGRVALVALVSGAIVAGAELARRTRQPVVPPQAAKVQPTPVAAPDPAEDYDNPNPGNGAGNGTGSGPGQGAKKWRDTGVYVDGRPVGVLAFGELPVTLKPVWREVPVSVELKPGQKGLGFKIVKERAYRFVDLLKSFGVDLAKVKEIHLYGPQPANAVVATGKELREHGAGFMFRFGGHTSGKALPMVPPGFGNGRAPDKITAVLVYVNLKPPTLVHNEGFELDGKLVSDIPYHGEPLRGGVRVYENDRLTMSIKRPMLRDTEPVERAPDGTPKRWQLLPLLASNGVKVAKFQEAWLIHDERRVAKFSHDQLASLTVEMGEQGQNEIFVGDRRIATNAIALHRAPIPPNQLPQVLPDEED